MFGLPLGDDVERFIDDDEAAEVDAVALGDESILDVEGVGEGDEEVTAF